VIDFVYDVIFNNIYLIYYDHFRLNWVCHVWYYYLQDLCKYTRGDIKQDNEVQIIQSIIGAGINREELRDEIFVQCMRQATNNPNTESTERVWLLICLAIVAFQPSKLLYKVHLWPKINGCALCETFSTTSLNFAYPQRYYNKAMQFPSHSYLTEIIRDNNSVVTMLRSIKYPCRTEIIISVCDNRNDY